MREAFEQLTTEAAKLASSVLWSLSDTELEESLEAVHRLEQTVAAAKLHMVREIEARGIPSAQHFRSTAGWLRSRLRLDQGPAQAMVKTAALLQRRPVVDEALCTGQAHVAQAAVIAAAVDKLPAEAGAEAIAAAETMLLHKAGELEPNQLRQCGERILEHVAPDLAEQTEREALDRADARAHAGRSLTMTMPEDGQVRIFGSFTVEDAAIVNAALDPLCRPRPGDDRSYRQRRADALVDICRLALRTGQLPDSGGTPPQLAVTIAYDPLTRQLGTGTLDNGERLAPAAVRRLACDAQVLPIVLGSQGEVLDAGRNRRLAKGPLRRALIVRDRGCAFPGCNRPAQWCDAHHLVPWSEDGPTTLGNLVLLCRNHHRTVHSGDWQVRLGEDELPEFIPPPWTDPRRRPRRNAFHQRT